MHVSGIGEGERLVHAGFLLVAAWVLPATVVAGEPVDQPERLPLTARRSHIQSIGEMRKPEPVGRLAAFGLELSRAPEILRRQLALSRGEGLVVDAVSPQSAAARIGIQPHDVLVRLDDQLLVLPEQLAVLLEVIPLPSAEVSPAETLPPGGIMKILRAGRALDIPLGQPALAVAAPAPPVPAFVDSNRPQGLLRQPASAVELASGGKLVPAVATDEAVLLREDDDFTIRLIQAEDTRLIVLTPTGRSVFNGRIDSPERLAKVPPVLRPRVDAMLQVLGPRPPAAEAALGAAPVAVSR